MTVVIQQIFNHKSVAFEMYSLITRITCWKTIVLLYDIYLLNLWEIFFGGLGWSTCSVIAQKVADLSGNCHFWIG